MSAAFKRQLANWIASHADAGMAGDAGADVEPADRLTEEGYLPRARRLDGKRALVRELDRWLRESTAPTIGDVAAFAGKPWVMVQIGQREVALNADTKRSAVETFVRGSRGDPDRLWRVVAGRGGRINKVVPNLDADPLPGWYAYLGRPLETPGTI